MNSKSPFHNKSTRQVMIMLLAIVTVAACFLDYWLPAMGDDLRFAWFLGLDDYRFPDRSTLSFLLGHFTGCNGRLFDGFGPVVIDMLPRCVAALIMGCMMGFYFYTMIKGIGLRHNKSHVTLLVMFVTAIVALMPWWDSMWLRVCQFNYVWGTAFALLTIRLFFNTTVDKPRLLRGLLLFAVAFCAADSHEQIGLSLTSSIVAIMVLKPQLRHLDASQRWLLWGVVAGTVISLSSPGLWVRDNLDAVVPSFTYIVVSTIPIYVLLLITLVSLCITARGRRFVSQLVDDNRFVVMLLVATASCAIAIVSFIPGRTGWLTESLSLVMLARMAVKCDVRIGRPVAATLSIAGIVFIILHYVLTISWERRLWNETNEFKQRFVTSKDGVVYYDATGRYDVPVLTLYRIKGIPDADDWWYNAVIEEVYGNGDKKPIVLPMVFAGRLDDVTDTLSIGDVTYYRELPPSLMEKTHNVNMQPYGDTYRVLTQLPDGKGYMAIPLQLDLGYILDF